MVFPVFPCPGRYDESRWWEVDLEHASSRVMAGHHLELRSRSEGSGLLGHHQRVWQRDRIIQAFVCGLSIDEAMRRAVRHNTTSEIAKYALDMLRQNTRQLNNHQEVRLILVNTAAAAAAATAITLRFCSVVNFPWSTHVNQVPMKIFWDC